MSRISELPLATSVNGTDEVEINQGLVSKRARVNLLPSAAVNSVNDETGTVVLDATDVAIAALSPNSYTPVGASIEEHLEGIDNALAAGGVTTFTALTDTPASFSGQASKIVAVKSAEDGLEFIAVPGGGDMLASIYDPQAIAADAFDRANHTGTQLLSTISDVTISGTPADNELLAFDNASGEWINQTAAEAGIAAAIAGTGLSESGGQLNRDAIGVSDLAAGTANVIYGRDGDGNGAEITVTGAGTLSNGVLTINSAASPTRTTVTSANSPYTLTTDDRSDPDKAKEVFCEDGANNLIVELPEGFSAGNWIIKRGANHTGDVLVRGKTLNVSIDGIAGPTNGINIPASGLTGLLSMDANNVARWEGASTQDQTLYGGLDRNGQTISGAATVTGATTHGSGGTVDFNGEQVSGNIAGTSVADMSLDNADSGKIVTTTGNVTIPTTAGFNVTLVAGGAHTVSNGTITSAAMAAGDVMSVFNDGSGDIHAVLTASADKVSFT